MPPLRRAVRLGTVGPTIAGVAVLAAVGAGVLVTRGSDQPARPQATTVAAPLAPSATPVLLQPSVVTPAKPNTRSTVVAAPNGVRVYDAPDGRVTRTLPGRTDLGAVQTMLTVGARGGWWQVALPVRPNTATGWVRKADVQASTVDVRIEIDRKAHRLTLLRNGAVAKRIPVAVGTKATPTPAGRFYVTDNLATGNPGGAYGPYALGLSGHSDVLFTFGSGDGVLGIHGTNEPGSIGSDASHGCIRLRNADITALRALTPLGTPVVIS